MTLKTTTLDGGLLTRKPSPAGADILLLTDPATGKDHWVFLSDIQSGQSYPSWLAGQEYSEGERVTFGFKLYESLQDENTGHIPSGGVGDVWWKEVSESSKPDRLERIIAKDAHGFVLGDVLRIDNTGALVKVSNPITQKFTAIVTEVINVDNFRIVLGGFVNTLAGLTIGAIHYAQADGTLDTVVTKMPVLIASSATSGYVLASGSGVQNFTELEDAPSTYVGNSLKIVRVNVGETGLEFFTLSATPLTGTYDDIAALIADQGAQDENKWYMVLDATDDPAVDEGWAVYQYLGTTNGDLTDYFLVQKLEALEAWPDLIENTVIDGMTFSFQMENLSAFNILADAVTFTTDLFKVVGAFEVDLPSGGFKVNDDDGVSADGIGVKLFNPAASYEEGERILFFGVADTAPTTPPTAGVFEWVAEIDGVHKKHMMDTSGNITVF